MEFNLPSQQSLPRQRSTKNGRPPTMETGGAFSPSREPCRVGSGGGGCTAEERQTPVPLLPPFQTPQKKNPRVVPRWALALKWGVLTARGARATSLLKRTGCLYRSGRGFNWKISTGAVSALTPAGMRLPSPFTKGFTQAKSRSGAGVARRRLWEGVTWCVMRELTRESDHTCATSAEGGLRRSGI
ncbi:unnamed protein product [Ixodes pacificus]